jgi:hypothetical protein
MAGFYSELEAAGFGGTTDHYSIRTGLVVLPVQSNTIDTPTNVPGSLFTHDDTTFETTASRGGLFQPRVLWRGMNTLFFHGAQVSDSKVFTCDLASCEHINVGYRQQSTLVDGQCGSQLQHVKTRCTLGQNEGLFFVVESSNGMIADEGDLLDIQAGLNFFGVAAIKTARTNR